MTGVIILVIIATATLHLIPRTIVEAVPIRMAFKTLPIVLLLLFAIASKVPMPMIMALVFCLVGDAALELDTAAKGETASPQPWFLVGLAAFLAGHIAYLVGFIQQAHELPPSPQTVLIIAAAVLSLFILLPKAGPLKFAVAGYVVAICAMAVAALATRNPIWIAGACAFMASDFILGLLRFVFKTDNRWKQAGDVLLWILYIAAQMMITFGATTP